MAQEKRLGDFGFSCNRMQRLLEIREKFMPVVFNISKGTALHDDYSALAEQLEKTIAAEARYLNYVL